MHVTQLAKVPDGTYILTREEVLLLVLRKAMIRKNIQHAQLCRSTATQRERNCMHIYYPSLKG